MTKLQKNCKKPINKTPCTVHCTLYKIIVTLPGEVVDTADRPDHGVDDAHHGEVAGVHQELEQYKQHLEGITLPQGLRI